MAVLHLKLGLDDVGVCDFPALFKVLCQFQETVALLSVFLCGFQLKLRGGDGVITLYNRNNKAARSNFSARLRKSRRRGSPAVIRNRQKIDGFMNVGLADVFVSGIVGDESDVVVGTELRVKRLIVVSDGGKQRRGCLVAILAGNRGIGLRSQELRAVLSGARKGIFKCEAEHRRSGSRRLLDIIGW